MQMEITSLEVAEKTTDLIFSFLGFSSQEVKINGRTNIDITLTTDLRQLNEVVVTALGIKKDIQENRGGHPDCRRKRDCEGT
jgi:hypothetical protein